MNVINALLLPMDQRLIRKNLEVWVIGAIRYSYRQKVLF